MQSIHIAKSGPAPKFLMHRKYLLLLPLFLLIFVLAACGGKDFSPPAQPNLSLQAGELSDGGLRTVACWPKGEKNVSCEFTTDANNPNPSSALTVQGGQAVNVVIANPEGVALPKQVVITSRETDAAGAPLFTMQIDPAQSTEFVLALPNGRYLLDVTAYYPDIEGSSATVSNVFAVDVGEAIASNVTPEATAELTTEATTPEVTAEITETPTVEVTEVATEAITPEATLEVTAEITEEPTVAATEETGISGGNVSETPAATEEVVEPTAEPTEVVTEEVASATPKATESTTPVTPVATTPVATEEVVVPTEVATEVPTEVITEVSAPPTATSTPTLPPPTPTNTATSTPTVPPTSTATPTLGISPTNTSVFDVDAPPAVTLRVSGRNYQPVGYDYCRRNATNELVCVKQPFSTSGSTSIRAARNAAANIRIDGDRPISIEISYLSRDTLQPIATETRTGDKVVLFNFGVAAGSYVLSVEVAWSDVTVTYYFQIQVLQ